MPRRHCSTVVFAAAAILASTVLSVTSGTRTERCKLCGKQRSGYYLAGLPIAMGEYDTSLSEVLEPLQLGGTCSHRWIRHRSRSIAAQLLWGPGYGHHPLDLRAGAAEAFRRIGQWDPELARAAARDFLSDYGMPRDKVVGLLYMLTAGGYGDPPSRRELLGGRRIFGLSSPDARAFAAAVAPDPIAELRWTPLHFAAYLDDAAAAAALMEQGVDVDVQDRLGMTPLHWAAQEGSLAVLGALLDHGADPQATAGNGCTAIHFAAEQDDTRVLERLVVSGGDVCHSDAIGVTPLHVAAWYGNAGVARLIVTAGGDVDAADQDGHRPLHWAAEQGDVELVGFLLSRGAEVSPVDREGKTPLCLALAAQRTDVAHMLRAHGARR